MSDYRRELEHAADLEAEILRDLEAIEAADLDELFADWTPLQDAAVWRIPTRRHLPGPRGDDRGRDAQGRGRQDREGPR